MFAETTSRRGGLGAMTARFAVAAMAVAAAVPMASADVILGNYPITNDGTQTADVDNLRQKALRFTMPAGVDYNITSIVLRLGNYHATDVPILEIRDFNGTTTSPGAGVVGSFIAPLGGGAANADYSFAPSGSITLLAGSSYWIVLRGDSAATSFDWKAASPGVTPTGIATFGPGNLFTSNGGTTWATSTTLTSFVINGTPVPAPGVLAMIGVAALVGSRRRRR